MNIEEYLDSFVVTKSLLGESWEYWEENRNKDMFTYLIDSSFVEIRLVTSASLDKIVLGMYYRDASHESATKMKIWRKLHMKTNIQYKIKKSRAASKETLKTMIVVNSFEELKEFFKTVF